MTVAVTVIRSQMTTTIPVATREEVEITHHHSTTTLDTMVSLPFTNRRFGYTVGTQCRITHGKYKGREGPIVGFTLKKVNIEMDMGGGEKLVKHFFGYQFTELKIDKGQFVTVSDDEEEGGSGLEYLSEIDRIKLAFEEHPEIKESLIEMGTTLKQYRISSDSVMLRKTIMQFIKLAMGTRPN